LNDEKDWIDLRPIPIKGKHLDQLGIRDKIYITFSLANTVPFTYFYARFTLQQPNIVWEFHEATIWNTLVPLPALFIIFDFFYTLLHWFLHHKLIYSYIHKHHHQQKAPSRANIDAVNVHPIEFILGEYNHLLALYLCSTYIFPEIHVLCAILFLVLGGFVAGLNHTRHDVTISIPWRNHSSITLYDSKAHDVHHRIPQSNYGQYSMLWDHIFGSYR
jgi:sterol desaturase/sphingolipid hydroxylase (fatty acid hydroxylase superfamily)